MPLLPTSPHLSHTAKDTLIAALTARLAVADARIAAQDVRIAALEARLEALTRPPKTPGNSSKPPSKARSKTFRSLARLARLAKAAPVLAGRCIRTPIEKSNGGWQPARNAKPCFRPDCRPNKRSTTASSCRRFART